MDKFKFKETLEALNKSLEANPNNAPLCDEEI